MKSTETWQRRIEILSKPYKLLKENDNNDLACQFRNLESQQIILNYYFRSTNIFKSMVHAAITLLQEIDSLEFSETWQRRQANSDTKIRNTQNKNRNIPGIIIEIVQAFLRNAFEVSTNKFSYLRSCSTTCKLNPNCHFLCE